MCQYDVRQFMIKNKVSFMCLLETRVKQGKKEEVLEKICNWECLDNYKHSPNGRIWVVWDKQIVTVNLVKGNDQYLNCSVRMGQVDFLLTVVYAENIEQLREPLWAELLSIAETIQGPWMLVGDFNTTLVFKERMKQMVHIGGKTSEL